MTQIEIALLIATHIVAFGIGWLVNDCWDVWGKARRVWRRFQAWRKSRA